MTPEEQMRMSMAIQRAIGAGEQPPPGMISQSAVTPEMAAMASQDFSAAQGRLAQQQRMAQMLMQRSQDVPQGVQAGNVYVAGANPMTALAQALSGYQAGRTLRNMNEGYDDLERRMGEANTAKGEVAAVQDQRDARKLRNTLQAAAAQQEHQRLMRLETERNNNMRNERAKERNEAVAGKSGRKVRASTTVVDPKDPQSKPRRAVEYTDGSREYEDGSRVPDTAVDWNTYSDNLRADASAAKTGQEKADTRRAEKLDVSVQKYGAELDKDNIPRLRTDMAQVDRMLTRLPKKKDGSPVEIPGVGFLQNTEATGGALALAESRLGGKVAGVDPVDMRNAIQRVLNTEIRTQSGAAVTLHEMVRNRMGAGLNWYSSDENFMTMWNALHDVISEIELSHASAFGPEVVEIYERRKNGESLTSREYLEEKAAPPPEAAKPVSELTDEELQAEMARLKRLAQ